MSLAYRSICRTNTALSADLLVDYMYRSTYNFNQARPIIKCGIAISLIFNRVLQYLPLFLTVLRYWALSNVPVLTNCWGSGAKRRMTFHTNKDVAGSWQIVFNTKNLPNQFLLFVIMNPFPLRTPEYVVQRLPIIILQVMKIQIEDQYFKFKV